MDVTTDTTTNTHAMTLAELLRVLGLSDEDDVLPPFWD